MKRIPSGNDAEVEALFLAAALPHIQNTFVELTDEHRLHRRWNPLEDPIDPKLRPRPSDEELKQIAAIRFLNDQGYVAEVIEKKPSGFVLIPTSWAFEVRQAYDAVSPDEVKQLREELSRVREEHRHDLKAV